MLPPAVSSRIAAGEVIERPAAAVKELIENSLDAGSSFIVIEVEDGGIRLIRVSDNGEGMTKDDALLACQRFATSKLASEEDLFRITTLGFRGEALPSMAAISKFRLLTTLPGCASGTEIIGTSEGTWQVSEKAAVPGTQVELRDMFYNTPGRRKFLKTPATEFSHIGRLVQQTALAWPSVHFRLVHQRNVVYDYPAVSSRTDRYLQVYGSRMLDHSLPVEYRHEGIALSGMIVNPCHARTSRSPQEIFVNRRPVKNTTISHALYEAYETFLPPQRHPTFILFLDIAPDAVDVNVHPTKREVRFSRADMVYRAVKTAVRQTLFGHAPSSLSFCSPKSDELPASPFETSVTEATQTTKAREESLPLFLAANNDLLLAQRTASISSVREAFGPDYRPPQTETVMPLGQVRLTYLVAEVGGELQIVDQHTAHERVLFERLWRNWRQRSIQTQELLIPEPLEVPPHLCALLESSLEALAEVGVTIDRFGSHTFVLRSLPSILGSSASASWIQALVEELAEIAPFNGIEKRIRAILATMACKSAVQAGRAMTRPEIAQLLTDWTEEGCPMTCPHGRRIALRFHKEELDRVFARA